jgi:hypothetical protein
MTSLRQIEANRRNSRKSTGPTTEKGKRRSRCNAVRHGLTAETVIGTLEDAEDYAAFQAAVIADYDAQSAVERELVLRLASLLWRLRRTTTIETGLFEIQADHLREFRRTRQVQPGSQELASAIFAHADLGPIDCQNAASNNAATASLDSFKPRSVIPAIQPTSDDSAIQFARCFLRLSNLPNFVFERLRRYEVALWRQVDQLLFALDQLDRRKPHERRHRLVADGEREPSGNSGSYI